MDALSAASTAPYSAHMDAVARQNELLGLKAALNEKDMELIELREQHMQLVVRAHCRAVQLLLTCCAVYTCEGQGTTHTKQQKKHTRHTKQSKRRGRKRRAATGRPRSSQRTALLSSSRTR
jgi:hypothetical protein